MTKDKLGNMLAAELTAIWQKRKGWVQTEGLDVGGSGGTSHQNQSGGSKKRGCTSLHRWVRVHELHGKLALRCWWRPQCRWVRLASSCSQLWGSLQVPPALCWLAQRKKPFPSLSDFSAPYWQPDLGTFWCVILQQQWHPVASWILLGKAWTVNSL